MIRRHNVRWAVADDRPAPRGAETAGRTASREPDGPRLGVYVPGGGAAGSPASPAPPAPMGRPSPPFQSRLVYERAGRLERLTGNILLHEGRWVFRRDLAGANLLRVLDALCIDRALLEHLEAARVDEVHYRYEGQVYAVSLERL